MDFDYSHHGCTTSAGPDEELDINYTTKASCILPENCYNLGFDGQSCYKSAIVEVAISRPGFAYSLVHYMMANCTIRFKHHLEKSVSTSVQSFHDRQMGKMK